MTDLQRIFDVYAKDGINFRDFGIELENDCIKIVDKKRLEPKTQKLIVQLITDIQDYSNRWKIAISQIERISGITNE